MVKNPAPQKTGVEIIFLLTFFSIDDNYNSLFFTPL
jgi:hypothetical protein